MAVTGGQERDSRAVLSRPAAAPDTVLQYADGELHVVDVYLPAGVEQAPEVTAVFAIHGGFWRDTIDRVHARPMAEALRDAGCIVFVPEYRRANPEQPAWPAAIDDLRRALAHSLEWLTSTGVTPHRTVVTGHSAGGHLSLLLSQHAELDVVVPLAPVADLGAAERENLGDGAAKVFMGGGLADLPQAYAEADPAVVLKDHARASRISIVHGADDDIVPVSNARSFIGAVPEARLTVIDGADHFSLIDPEQDAWAVVLAEITGAG